MPNVPLAAEPILHIASFPITNAQVNAFVALGIFLILAFLLRRPKEIPGRLQNAFEMLMEGLLALFDQVTHDRALSKKFLPFVGTLFIFILLSNWMGLLPGTGSIGVWEIIDGERELVPLFRPAMSDLNLTIAMALVTVVVSHVVGIFTLGFFTHIGKFIQVAGIWRAIKKFSPVGILVALIEFVVGLIEIVSEVAKIASLSLRLFGNIFAGEVLLTVMASLVSFFVPLPFMAMEIIVGVVQATVFSMLTLVYLTIMTTKPHGEAHASEDTQHASRNTQHTEQALAH
jgi:F-type H+-transporting ATPase subunit a